MKNSIGVSVVEKIKKHSIIVECGPCGTLEVVSEGHAEMMLQRNDKEQSDEYKKEGTRWREYSELRWLHMLLP